MSDIPADGKVDPIDPRAVLVKIDRDRMLAPWLAIVGLVGGIITDLGALAHRKGWAV